ncbi:MAG: iron uptake porin [Nostocaceae cyanobacterium]|nr:iron uptake porin [Nostocaceae cyanobacterium]
MSLPLTSVILGFKLFIVPPVFGQTNVSNPLLNAQITANLPENNIEETSEILGSTNPAEKQIQPIKKIDSINVNSINKSLGSFSVTNFNFNSLSFLEKQSLNNSSQLSFDNRLHLATFNSESEVEENFANHKLQAQIEGYNEFSNSFEEIINVDQLEDVTPDHWAYEALRNLIENYRCINSSVDKTFNGNRAMTRYEFADMLNSCLLKIRRSIEGLNNKFSTQEDLAIFQRLQTEFAEELATIQTKIDNQERQITFLEERNFSTTTILRGQVDFLAASVFGDRKAVSAGESPTEDLDSNITFAGRVVLNFDTSFTGKDLLRTRLQAGNVNNLGSGVTGTAMTKIAGATNTDNDVRIGKLFYRFPLGDKALVYLAAASQSSSDFVPVLNPASTISVFGFYNPIYDLGFGAGGGIYYQLTDEIGAALTYYTASNSDPQPGKGLFNGDYTALGQITFTPSDRLGIVFSYAHYYSPEPESTNNVTSFIGSEFAQFPFGENTATSSDNFNLAASYQISDRLKVGGWLGYTNAVAESSFSSPDNGLNVFRGADADIWTWAFAASFSDLGKLGSSLNFILGMPPKLSDNDISGRRDTDTSYHIELSYKYPLTERIFVTPGFFVITNPEHNAENDAIWVGVLRTTIQF